MHLTRFSDAALRVLLHLANLTPSEHATTKEIADKWSVPYDHLNKVVHRLSQEGWVLATRGRGGGLRLALPPKSIHLGAVLRTTEPPGEIVNCFDTPCPLSGDCALEGVLREAKTAFYAKLDEYTLADVAGKELLELA